MKPDIKAIQARHDKAIIEEWRYANIKLSLEFVIFAHQDIKDLLAEVEKYRDALQAIEEIVDCGEDCKTYACMCASTMQQIATQALGDKP